MKYNSEKIVAIINELNSWIEGFMLGSKLDDSKYPEVFNNVGDALSEFEALVRSKENNDE